ncbi:methyltransferase domain-containing protein [Pelagibius sp. Alg239-R121]|uniref:methyltransferase domain-containing protein n=1 Tax=Pelagibius sp. Alg239-R121 TaxID=2993448 RepID=UPI0024A68383|nr:methyltransferase domain-containing protein [Pelagibius sp. Alg239-R121]
MNDDMSESSEYIHGSSPEEQHRLSLLNDILNESCLKELNLQPGENVLDVGSGLGQFTRLIARTVGSERQVVGIERDRDQMLQAKRLADSSGESELVEFRKGDALELPLSEPELGTFDVAHARFLLEHVPRPSLVIAQMVRSVRPGGRVFVTDDDHGNFRPWPEPQGFQALWQAYVRSYDRLGSDPYVGRRLVSLLRGAGLTSIRNSCVFFGGCAGNEVFQAVADNLIAALAGTKDAILNGELLDEESFDSGIDGLQQWKANSSAALWYSACCAEGIVPN